MAVVRGKYRNGVPCWPDVAVGDLEGCRAFYAGLFGWDWTDQGPEAGHYTMFSKEGDPVAGMGPRAEGMEAMPLWGTTLAVDDLEATVAEVEPAGGTVLMAPMDVMTAGRMAVVADAAGAVVSLWQAGDHDGARRVNEPGTVVWNELTTRDPEAAAAFYTRLVGWEVVEGESMPGYRLVHSHGRLVGGIMPMEGEEWGDLPSHWMTYFCVDDVDATAARVAELGGAVSVPPFDVEGVGRMAVVNDVDGNAFSLMASDTVDDPNEGWTD